MKIGYKNARILTPHGYVNGGFSLENGIFCDVAATTDGEDLRGLTVLPGLADIHTHGCGGYDFNTFKNDEQLDEICRAYAANGATTVLATLMTASEDELCAQLRMIAKADRHRALLKGVHLEGPFLSHEYKGAMPEQYLLPPSYETFMRFQQAADGLVRYITVSPELDGACEFVRRVSADGVRVTLGHSGASCEQALRCLDAGAVGFTHTFNAMRPLEHHDASIVAAALMSGAYCEAIVDGVHLCGDIVKMLYRVKGKERLCGITDSLLVAGMPDGDYVSGGVPVRKVGADVKVISSGTRAGSSLGIFDGLRNLAKFAQIDTADAVRCVSLTPLELLGLDGAAGTLENGKAADFIVCDDEKLLMTVCAGKVLYRADE